jgi:hypothetical protein
VEIIIFFCLTRMNFVSALLPQLILKKSPHSRQINERETGSVADQKSSAGFVMDRKEALDLNLYFSIIILAGRLL